MKTLIILSSSLALSGCFYQTITTSEIEMGTAICMVKEKLPPKEFRSRADGGEVVVCYNGEDYFIQKENLK